MPVSKIFKRGFLIALLLFAYLVTSVPVGLFLYSLKSDIGINVFSNTGFHSYMRCLRQEAYATRIKDKEKRKKKTSPAQ